jgi:UDP:flavonoid glycosyltransferase YjiC (YdhE family)
VYLNPYFTDPALAAAIETALAGGGHAVHAIGEGFAGRPGWHARDPQLVEAIAAADVFVSAAGMATLNQARTFGVPFVALATAQPEQRRNLAPLRADPGGRCRVVDLGPALAPRLAAAVAALADTPSHRDARPDARLAVARLQARWVEALTHLIDTREELP